MPRAKAMRVVIGAAPSTRTTATATLFHGMARTPLARQLTLEVARRLVPRSITRRHQTRPLQRKPMHCRFGLGGATRIAQSMRRSANFAAMLREAAAGCIERHERRGSIFFQPAQPFGSAPRPAGRHQLERTLVVRIRQFGGQIAARSLTSKAFHDQMHVQRLRQQCNGRPAYARNVARACAANVTGQDTFSRLGRPRTRCGELSVDRHEAAPQ